MSTRLVGASAARHNDVTPVESTDPTSTGMEASR